MLWRSQPGVLQKKQEQLHLPSQARSGLPKLGASKLSEFLTRNLPSPSRAARSSKGCGAQAEGLSAALSLVLGLRIAFQVRQLGHLNSTIGCSGSLGCSRFHFGEAHVASTI